MTAENVADVNSEHDPDLAALRSLTTHLRGALDSIEDHQWPLSTPCADWDLSGLVDHVTGGNWFTTRILAGQSAAGAMAETVEQFDGRSATGEEAASSLDDQYEAFIAPGVLDRIWNHVVGDLTGRQVLRLRLHDLIVHTWDIEQSVGPPASVPEDLARWGLAELANDQSLTARHFGLTTRPGLGPEAAEDAAAAYLSRFRG